MELDKHDLGQGQSNTGFEGELQWALLQTFKNRIKVICQEETDKAMNEVRSRIAQEVDKVALNMLSYYTIERFGQELRITVKKEI